MKITLGSELLENYRGNLEIESKRTSINIVNSQGQSIEAGFRTLPIDTYTITANSESGYILSEFMVNGELFNNGSSIDLKFGSNINIEATSIENVTSNPVSDFTFSGNSVTGYVGTSTDVIIPRSYSIASDGSYIEGNDYDVTDIAAGAFRSNTTITYVKLLDNILTVQNYAFRDCNNVTTLKLGESIQTIGQSAFSNMPKVTSLTIPDSVTTLNRDAFANFRAMTELNIGTGLTEIPSGCFNYCSALISLTIPDNITSIDSNAFASCQALRSLHIGKNLETIASRAFYQALQLSTITISPLNNNFAVLNDCLIDKANKSIILGFPRSTRSYPSDGTVVNKISAYSSYYSYNSAYNTTICYALEIPDNYTTIENYGIQGYGINYIVMRASTPPTLSGTYGIWSGSRAILVPPDSVTTYQTANYWSNWSTKIKALEEIHFKIGGKEETFFMLDGAPISFGMDIWLSSFYNKDGWYYDLDDSKIYNEDKTAYIDAPRNATITEGAEFEVIYV